MVDDLDSSEQTAFVVEGEVDPIVRGALDKHLKDQSYNEAKVPQWISRICEDVMEGLTDLTKPFKYVVTCIIMQNTGAGMHTEHSGFCDTVNDGLCVVKWPAEKSKDQNTMYAIVTVYGLGF